MFDPGQDPITILRAQQLSGGDSLPDPGLEQDQQVDQTNGGMVPPPSLPVSQFGSATPVNSGFTPSTVAQKRLEDLLAQQPHYQKPGLFTRIAAGMTGFGYGPQAAREVLEAPYNRDLNSWQNQVKVAQQLAQDENQTNNTNRIALYNSGTLQSRADKLAQDKDIAEGKLANAQELTKIKQQNANTYAGKLAIAQAAAQGHDIKFLPDNTAVIVHHDGTTIPVTGEDGTTVVFQTPKELQEAKDTAAMSRVQVQQEGATNRTNITTNAANNRADNANALKGWTFFTGPDGTIWRGNADTGEAHPISDLPTGTAKTPSMKLPTGSASPYGTTTETTVETPQKEIFGFKIPGTGGVSKSTTTVKTPNTAPVVNKNAKPISNDERAQATQILTNAKHPVTDANIQEVVNQLRAKSGGS